MTAYPVYASRLEKVYALTVQSKSVKGFFTHLLVYIDTILNDNQLSSFVDQAIEESYRPLALKAEELGLDGQEAFIRNAIDIRHSSQLWYCWAKLLRVRMSFADYPYKLETPTTHKQLTDRDYLTGMFTKVFVNRNFEAIFKNDTDEWSEIKRDDYQLSLEVFNSQLVSLLNNTDHTVTNTDNVVGTFSTIIPNDKSEPPVVVGDLKIENDDIYCNDRELPLTPKEGLVLRLLIKEYPRTVTNDRLREDYWENEYEGNALDDKTAAQLMSSIYTAVKVIRKALRERKSNIHIITKPKIGYYLKKSE